ncbi:hypothetical protein CDAR_578601 [Caerostris darwini]|uniref:Uncharacterized protein n=1 Tax=Caerostris darwini TaxID=1538125 RepID=A0AAV4UBW1_9ARAC|nr:hypothetical protein CDAR_578601 [Caerostris darwini]
MRKEAQNRILLRAGKKDAGLSTHRAADAPGDFRFSRQVSSEECLTSAIEFRRYMLRANKSLSFNSACFCLLQRMELDQPELKSLSACPLCRSAWEV